MYIYCSPFNPLAAEVFQRAFMHTRKSGSARPIHLHSDAEDVQRPTLIHSSIRGRSGAARPPNTALILVLQLLPYFVNMVFCWSVSYNKYIVHVKM